MKIDDAAARLEALADAVGSIAVLASSIAIALGAWTGIDVLVALAIAAFIVPRAIQLLRQSADILLESAPAGLDPLEIVAASTQVPGVVAAQPPARAADRRDQDRSVVRDGDGLGLERLHDRERHGRAR